MTTPVTPSDHIKSIVDNGAKTREAVKSTVDQTSTALDARTLADRLRRNGG